jgi:hypothetical protein
LNFEWLKDYGVGILALAFALHAVSQVAIALANGRFRRAGKNNGNNNTANPQSITGGSEINRQVVLLSEIKTAVNEMRGSIDKLAVDLRQDFRGLHQRFDNFFDHKYGD